MSPDFFSVKFSHLKSHLNKKHFLWQKVVGRSVARKNYKDRSICQFDLAYLSTLQLLYILCILLERQLRYTLELLLISAHTWLSGWCLLCSLYYPSVFWCRRNNTACIFLVPCASFLFGPSQPCRIYRQCVVATSLFFLNLE